MSENTAAVRGPAIELPVNAPRVRVTAGAGSVAQKTWNLRRPVTLLGSRRPSHIVLRDNDVSRAHCVIINTGTEVLLKDLHTTAGTFCNKARIDLTVLNDGDVIGIGATRIQVAIQVSEDPSDDSGCGMEFVEPTLFVTPVRISLVHTDHTWNIREAAVLVGRHDDAAIRLDHEEISNRHAIIFRFDNGPAIFDLGSGSGTTLNGNSCSLAAFGEGDRIGIGPFGLAVDGCKALPLDAAKHATEHTPKHIVDGEEAPTLNPPGSSTPAPKSSPLNLPGEFTNDLPAIEHELESIRKAIHESWGRLNSRESELLRDASAIHKQKTDLSAREEQLNAKDASLRGQLHDLTHYHGQLTDREKELAEQLKRMQDEKDALAAAQRDGAARETEITRRMQELTRREHVLAQRWTRLYAAKCPNCRQAFGTPNDAS